MNKQGIYDLFEEFSESDEDLGIKINSYLWDESILGLKKGWGNTILLKSIF